MGFAYQYAFYFLGVSLAYIVSFLLIRSTAEHKVANRMLGIAFFSMAWYNMIYLLTLTKVYPQVYWLAGWGPSMSFLIAPCAYLYVRMMVTQRDKFEKTDWLHFLPFLIFFVDMLPFSLGFGRISKAEYVHNAMANYNQFYLQHVSLIPLRLHFVFRPAQGIVYLFFQWRLLIRHRALTKRIQRWLMTLTVLQTLFSPVVAVMTYEGFSTGQGMYVAHDYRWIVYVLFCGFFLATLVLLSVPDALYGVRGREPYKPDLPKPESIPESPAVAPVGAAAVVVPVIPAPPVTASDAVPEPVAEARPVNARLIAQYVPVIESYLTDEQPYLQAKLSIQDMAVATRIPLHQLSYIINQHYGVRYTDLMNQYRVDHAKRMFAQGAWKELSLEGLGKKCGFSNRTNFFLVFKKITGQSPSEYLNALKTEENG